MATLVKPPPPDPSKSAIENLLQLTHLPDIHPDLFTNTRPLWHPPGARGVFGGAVIAHCLVAAQRTVPSNFTIHSMHCYFVLAGSPQIPIMYHVERVREGKSFATRTVQARQKGKAIFTTTLSFVKEQSGGEKTVEHAWEMPDVPSPVEVSDTDELPCLARPIMSQSLDVLNDDSSRPETKRVRKWVKARGQVSDAGGHRAHEAILAYVSDSYFVGSIGRVHNLWRFPPKTLDNKRSATDKEMLDMVLRKDDAVLERDLGMTKSELKLLRSGISGLSPEELERPEIGMMVSLDHTIYFHNPKAFRTDDWMLTDMESPWAGDGRGLVIQRIHGRDGTLIASCVQEGLIRLRQPGQAKL